ncbi:hypothetical protein REPUB_Repub01dG0098100 [Reevesia pubescens]
MGFSGVPSTDGGPEPDSESAILLHTSLKPAKSEDKFHLAYIIYFMLSVGFLLPWNAFITAVDYFSYLYPEASVDRVFAVIYFLIGLGCLLIIVFYAHKSEAYVQINVGLGLFVVSLLVVPILDAVNIKGVLVSLLRILTKAVFPQDADGLRKSANLYFSTSIVVMFICIVLYNVAHRLPVMKYYEELKIEAVKEEREEKGPLTRPVWRATLWNIVGTVKWYRFRIVLIYVVTLSIFPGYITEDVHSLILKDWYPILLITGYNVFDLVGKSLTAVYLLENAKVVIASCVVRLLFFPLYIGCWHGPQFFQTEIPVSKLTCLLGLTNGYLTSVLMIMAPKSLQIQHAEIAGIVMVLFLVIGLASGSVIAWFWVI